MILTLGPSGLQFLVPSERLAQGLRWDVEALFDGQRVIRRNFPNALFPVGDGSLGNAELPSDLGLGKLMTFPVLLQWMNREFLHDVTFTCRIKKYGRYLLSCQYL